MASFNLRDIPLTPEGLRAAVLGLGALAPLAYVTVVAMRPFVFFLGPAVHRRRAGLRAAARHAVRGDRRRHRRGGDVPARPRPGARLRPGAPTRPPAPPAGQRVGAGLVFVLLLVPIVPMTAVNYGAGLSRVSLAHYTLAVLGGLTPRAFAYRVFGDALFDVGSPQFMGALAVLASMVVVPALFRRRWLARWR
ncbi:MAG: VTT domain-containing protein [Candidatus Binatia bacterium]